MREAKKITQSIPGEKLVHPKTAIASIPEPVLKGAKVGDICWHNDTYCSEITEISKKKGCLYPVICGKKSYRLDGRCLIQGEEDTQNSPGDILRWEAPYRTGTDAWALQKLYLRFRVFPKEDSGNIYVAMDKHGMIRSSDRNVVCSPSEWARFAGKISDEWEAVSIGLLDEVVSGDYVEVEWVKPRPNTQERIGVAKPGIMMIETIGEIFIDSEGIVYSITEDKEIMVEGNVLRVLDRSEIVHAIVLQGKLEPYNETHFLLIDKDGNKSKVSYASLPKDLSDRLRSDSYAILKEN